MKNFNLKLKSAYSNFYSKGMWLPIGGESKSGLGSSTRYTELYSKNLVRIIEDYNIKKIFDTSCGDWFWMKNIKQNFEFYIGNDICQELIEENKKYKSDKVTFTNNDMLSQMKLYDDLEFDLVICRHTLEHLPTEYNLNSISEMKRISKYALITSANFDYSLNRDCKIEFNGDLFPPYNSINLDLNPYKEVLQDPVEKFWDILPENQSSNGTYGYLYKFI
jgi:hypothetical protein